MKVIKILIIPFLALFALSCSSGNKKNQDIANIEELASNFTDPPVEYSLSFYWGWDGKITEEVIARDLDAYKERGVHIVSLEAGYGMGFPYLSEDWFKLVKRTIELARERDMRVWLVDEGKYPSGFAGGKFTTDAPELRMKALVVAEQIVLAEGDSLNIELVDNLVGAVAVNQLDSSNTVLKADSGLISWIAPEGQWEVILVKHDFRSSPTRAVNNPKRGKDPSNSLCDYLDPAATQKFIEFTHEEYKKYVGNDFGKTVLGFRGDEPDYSIRGIPWTPQLFDRFLGRKGYDVRIHVASFFAPKLSDEQKRIRADYWDVWSELFAGNFFKVQADWCAAHEMEYLVHLNKEDNMMALVAHEGDFFRTMRHVQMPGIDAIWNQIWPDSVIADFPKYASSVAHVYGKPRAFTESFAAYRKEPDVQQGKWVLDHQLVRGINMVEVMWIPASTNGRLGFSNWTADESFPEAAKYIHRASYLLSQGVPAAEIAVYHPTTSMWLGDSESNAFTLEIMQQLMENQRDFDFIDEYALCEVLSQKKGKLINLSGQAYGAVILPSPKVISKKALEKLKEFASDGGKVIVLGKKPSLLIDDTFLKADEVPEVNWATYEPSGELASKVLAQLPVPDVHFNKQCPDVKYVHRKLRNGELYFFFNEGKERQTIEADLQGGINAQLWDAMTGEIMPMPAENSIPGFSRIQLDLEPWKSMFVVLID